MARSTYTSTTSGLIVDTSLNYYGIMIDNAGPGILDVALEEPGTSAAPTVSSTVRSYAIQAGTLWETPPGAFGRLYGTFRSAGTAYVTTFNQKL
jgi:hypothetical protein